jgi:adenosylhomocysteine nucleosidase
MIGIIAAMPEEAAAFEKWMEGTEKSTHAGLELVTGRIGGADVVLAVSGIGKVNGARCTQMLIDYFGASPILTFGVAGGIADGLDFGEVVISEDAAAYRFEPDKTGFVPTDVPFQNRTVYPADPALIACAERAARRLKLKARTGRVLTDDGVVADSRLKKALKDKMGGACVEMEGAAVAQTAEASGVPWLIVRGISDLADEHMAGTYDNYYAGAIAAAAATAVAVCLETADNQ